MTRLVLRIWLPDRPGALGAVASRVGAVRGDVVGIEVVERDGGVAVDDLVVDLPDEALLELLLAEVRQVDGVRIEAVSPDSAQPADPTAGAFAAAEQLMTAPDQAGLAVCACEQASRLVGADWAGVVDEEGVLLGAAGAAPVPAAAWLGAYRDGLKAGVTDITADPLCVPVPVAGWDMLVGRQARPIRARERQRLQGLARLVSARWVELALDQARALHPTVTGRDGNVAQASIVVEGEASLDPSRRKRSPTCLPSPSMTISAFPA